MVCAQRAITSPAWTVKRGPNFPEEGMAQGLLGRDAVLRVVHQQLLQQILPFWTQVGNQLCDACTSLRAATSNSQT